MHEANNLNTEFAKAVNRNAVVTDLPAPVEGQVWRHHNGLDYVIVMTNIEAAGHLRQVFPSGYFHLYRCMSTGKPYLRCTDRWELESQSFSLLEDR